MKKPRGKRPEVHFGYIKIKTLKRKKKSGTTNDSKYNKEKVDSSISKWVSSCEEFKL